MLVRFVVIVTMNWLIVRISLAGSFNSIIIIVIIIISFPIIVLQLHYVLAGRRFQGRSTNNLVLILQVFRKSIT